MRIATMSIRWMLVLLALVAPAHAADECGDADGSGAITVTDGVQTLRAAAGLGSNCTPARCDLDGGGTITVTDGVNVLRAAAGLTVNLGCPGAEPACASATATVALAVPQPIGAATLVLAYPPSAVDLPGTGDAAAERVTIVTTTALVGNGSPNDHDDRVEFSLVALDGLDDGTLLTVRFDCLGPAPVAAAFGCALTDVYGTDGSTPVDGATCSITVASE
jgi:hypothetical protein